MTLFNIFKNLLNHKMPNFEMLLPGKPLSVTQKFKKKDRAAEVFTLNN